MIKKWLEYIPLYAQISDHKFSDFGKDALAGITIGIVLIPQSMAYAVIAGLPPIYGLYGSLIPLLIYPFFASSRHLSIGPVALDMLILSSGLALLTDAAISEKIAMAIMITLCVGVIQISMGTFRLGFIFRFFSRPVISGFTSAAAIIIIFSQLNTLVRLESGNTTMILYTAVELIKDAEKVHFPTLWASLACIGFLITSDMISKKIPSAVILVVLTIIVSFYIDIESFGINTIEQIPQGLPELSIPQISVDAISSLSATIITLALVQFMSIAALTQTFSRRHSYTIDPNKEMVSMGLANTLGSFFKSIPVSGSFSRSAIAEQNNAQSSLTNIYAALIVMICLLFLTDLFERLPIPLLASIIVVSVFKLIDVKEIIVLYETKRRDAIVALVTFFGVIILGIEEGIILGIIVSIGAILYQLSTPTVAELGIIPGSQIFKNIERYDEAEKIDGILILRVDASFSFVNAQFFKTFIVDKSLEKDNKPEFVIIDGSTISDMDVSAIDSLMEIVSALKAADISLYVSGLIGPVRDVVSSSNRGFIEHDLLFYTSLHEAVLSALKHSNRDGSDEILKWYKDRSAS